MKNMILKRSHLFTLSIVINIHKPIPFVFQDDNTVFLILNCFYELSYSDYGDRFPPQT